VTWGYLFVWLIAKLTPYCSKTLSEKRATYHVTHLEQEGKGKPAIPLADVKSEFYLATWMDKNKNQVIDADELERMVLEFR